MFVGVWGYQNYSLCSHPSPSHYRRLLHPPLPSPSSDRGGGRPAGGYWKDDDKGRKWREGGSESWVVPHTHPPSVTPSPSPCVTALDPPLPSLSTNKGGGRPAGGDWKMTEGRKRREGGSESWVVPHTHPPSVTPSPSPCVTALDPPLPSLSSYSVFFSLLLAQQLLLLQLRVL